LRLNDCSSEKFGEDEHFSPVAISLLQMAYPLVIAGFMKITERLAKPFGRPHPGISMILKHTPGEPFSSILS